MIDVKVVGLNDYLHSRKCRVCGEEFTYYPAFHSWLAKVDGHNNEVVCSYHCMRKVERRLLEKRRDNETASYARTTVYRRPKPDAWYSREIEKCKARLAKVTEEIDRIKGEGRWGELTATKRKQLNANKLYYTDRIAVLERELKIAQERALEQ